VVLILQWYCVVVLCVCLESSSFRSSINGWIFNSRVVSGSKLYIPGWYFGGSKAKKNCGNCLLGVEYITSHGVGHYYSVIIWLYKYPLRVCYILIHAKNDSERSQPIFLRIFYYIFISLWVIYFVISIIR